jgi:hypothetical protein
VKDNRSDGRRHRKSNRDEIIKRRSLMTLLETVGTAPAIIGGRLF